MTMTTSELKTLKTLLCKLEPIGEVEIIRARETVKEFVDRCILQREGEDNDEPVLAGNLKKIRYLQDGYSLVTDSQDEKATLDHIGKPQAYEDYQGLIVKAGQDGFDEVWGFPGCVAFLDKDAERLI